jgi:hypothetical protein
LVKILTNAIPQSWQVYRELTVEDLMVVQAPLDLRDEWMRMCDEVTNEDIGGLEEDEEGETNGLSGAGSVRRKRPDAIAVNWGRRQLVILEFTRAYDSRAEWAEVTDEGKRRKYRSLQNKLKSNLPEQWQVETIAFSVGVRGSVDEVRWLQDLSRFGLRGKDATNLLGTLVVQALIECDEILATRQAALEILSDSAGKRSNAGGH